MNALIEINTSPTELHQPLEPAQANMNRRGFFSTIYTVKVKADDTIPRNSRLFDAISISKRKSQHSSIKLNSTPCKIRRELRNKHSLPCDQERYLLKVFNATIELGNLLNVI